MDALESTSSAASIAASVLKDTAGADLITKTLDKMNGAQMGGSSVDTGYQFVKDVLSAAGIGNNLDLKV